MPLARISLTLSRHFSLSSIASGRSSGLQLASSHSYWMYVRAGRPAFAWPYVGVHRSTSPMSLSLLLQQCPACLVSLTWIVFVIGGSWPYSWCLVGCCRQDLICSTFNYSIHYHFNPKGVVFLNLELLLSLNSRDVTSETFLKFFFYLFEFKKILLHIQDFSRKIVLIHLNV